MKRTTFTQSIFTTTTVLSMLCASLSAEIERITLNWTAQVCDQGCIQNLDKQFKKIPGVAKVDINQAGGFANIQWKPTVKFSFAPLNGAMSMLGLNINSMNAKVKGKIVSASQDMWLVSSGDGTRFLLKSSPIPNMYSFTMTSSINAYNLDAGDRQELLQAQKESKEVTVEGEIFQPERSPPFVIIMSNKQISKDSTN